MLLTMMLFTLPGVAEAQKWSTPLKIEVPPSEKVDWHLEVTRLTEELKEQAKTIEKLSQDLEEATSMKSVAPTECRCGTKWDAYEATIASLKEKIEESACQCSRERDTTFVPNTEEPKVIIEMQTFTEGRPCSVCNQWLSVEAGKFPRDRYTVQTSETISRGSAPQFVITLPSGKVLRFTGYQSAESLMRAVGK